MRWSRPRRPPVRLAMKVAVAVGTARRFVVGDPELQLIDVLAGRLVDQLAVGGAVRREGRGRARAVGARVAWRPRRDRRAAPGQRERTDNRRRLGPAPARRPRLPSAGPTTRSRRSSSAPGSCPPSTSGSAPAAASSSPSCVRRSRSSCTSPASTIDEDDDAAAKLDDFVRRAQRICAEYGGNLLQMTIGDKGAYLYAVFGSPHAHEDDGARAAAAALDLRALDGVTAVIGSEDRDRARPPAQRHLRPRDAAHLRLPGRRRQPRRASDGPRSARTGVRRRVGEGARRRVLHVGVAARRDS